MKKVFYMAVLTILCSVGAVQTAHAACSNPAGVEGEQVYNTTHKVMQYCNDTDWIRMGSGNGNGALPTCTIGDYLIMTASGFDCQSGAIPPPAGVKRVFVTGIGYHGNLGGLSGANAKCMARAALAGVTGTYKAWLSTNSSDPLNNFTLHTGEYQLLDGTKIADNFGDLTNGDIDNAINIDETGATVASSHVWTNTNFNGEVLGTATNSGGGSCYNSGSWNYSSSSYGGHYGSTSSTSSSWTANTGFNNCDDLKRLYCFEQ